MTNSRIPQGLLAAVAISISLVLCCWILAGAVVRIKSSNEVIRVTGSARKPIRSDFIIWHGHISLRSKSISQGYQDLKSGIDKAKSYLIAKGVTDSEITTSAIETATLYAKIKKSPNSQPEDESEIFRTIEGYSLSEDIEVRSTKVDLVQPFRLIA